LRLTEPGGEAESAVLRAQVRSVRAPKNPNELYQIGVELESPATFGAFPRHLQIGNEHSRLG
jgi:hypothetical protein